MAQVIENIGGEYPRRGRPITRIVGVCYRSPFLHIAIICR